jgi:hypothetical protein
VSGVSFLIAGTPRSGTTLVQRLACELPGVVVPPETAFWPAAAVALSQRHVFPAARGPLVDDLFTIAAVSRRLAAAGVDRAELADRLPDPCPSLWALFVAVVEAMAGPAAVHGEKSPRNLMWLRTLGRARADLRFVGVVREPRAVVASNLEAEFAHDVVAIHAEQWRADQQELLAARRELGDRLVTLRYEDVVADPEAARTAIGRLLGVATDAAPVVVPDDRLRLPHETWKTNAGGPVSTERVAAWPAVLSDRAAAQVLALTRSMLGPWGYGDAAPSRIGALTTIATMRPADHVRRWRARRARLGRVAAIEAIEL